MLVYYLVTMFSLCLMLGGLISIIINLALKKGEERTVYIRKFKMGKGILIYVFAIPLYWIAKVYEGGVVLGSLFSAIPHVLQLIVLKYDLAPLQALMEASVFYSVAVYICFTLVALNAIFFTVSVASHPLVNWVRNVRFRRSKKNKLILFGNNEHNYTLYKSAKTDAKTIVGRISDDEALALYMKGVAYTQVINADEYAKKVINDCLSCRRRLTVVINTEQDEQNIELSRHFIKVIDSLSELRRSQCYRLVRIFVFGDSRYQALYDDIETDGHGSITYVNKYQLIAMDFIDKHPLTRFMTDEHIDYNTSLVRKDVDINVVMIGFGRTNRQIFLTSVANNQFITEGKNGVELKPVNYHVFDKIATENDKNLNHDYNRYAVELEGADKEDYLPLPTRPAECKFYHTDINDNRFYGEVRSIVTSGAHDVNVVIIAFGSDLENVDMAQKLIAKRKEWGIGDLVIFVKVRNQDKIEHLLSEKKCYAIANESAVVYSSSALSSDSIFAMAKRRNAVYDVEYALSANPQEKFTAERVKQIKERSDENWYKKKSRLERESNIYCCLSLRSKLNMMGLDYAPKSDEREGLSEAEYLAIYAGEDKIERYEHTADGKPIVRYTLDFKQSRRKNMAEHEHFRWNSFMLSKGIIPATKEQILIEKNESGRYTNGKRYDLRRHGNLTTFDGLVEFRKMIAGRDGTSEQSVDVIKYDYQLLDDAYWLLDSTGNKIVKKA